MVGNSQDFTDINQDFFQISRTDIKIEVVEIATTTDKCFIAENGKYYTRDEVCGYNKDKFTILTSKYLP